MEGPKNHGHQHPLLMLNEELLINNGGGEAQCSWCWEKVSAPCFSCAEDCGFYLHKLCADAPSELNHPFHRPHPLVLQQSSSSSTTRCVCDFCDETCENLVYHCSCGLNFHVKCALLTFNIAKKNLQELEHVAVEDPLVSPKTDEALSKCFGCWEPLANYVHFSLDCGFKLHKKCAELSLKINHSCHRKHPLFLQFNSERLSCKICQVTRQRGLVYGCLPCKFVVHVECLAPVPTIEGKSHQHPFTLFWRQIPFICDACGSEGNHVAYACITCGIVVHKKCISLPRIIRHAWHEHRISHTYFLYKEDFRTLDCIMCHKAVDTEHGSYSCAECDAVFHVNCAMKEEDWYSIVSLDNEDDKSLTDMFVKSITNVLERNDAGEATLIEHFTHKHDLMLSDDIRGYDDKYCDGCLLPISALFYYCSLCDYFLHKACAELHRKTILAMRHVSPQILTTDIIFGCNDCGYLSNGFFYKCTGCGRHACLRCATLKPDGVRCAGHKHPLFFYFDFNVQCSACGRDIVKAYSCKDCNFHLDEVCARRPIKARHRCDEHLLTLTYHEPSDYSKYHYCDICEKRRDSNHWFYHCATCDTCAHVDCVLGKYPFFKLGSSHNAEAYHPHPLTFVKKFYDYPECDECGEPCQNLALECAEAGCNYIVDWECIEPDDLAIFVN